MEQARGSEVADAEPVIEVNPEDKYPFALDEDEALRCFIIECMSSSDIAGRTLIENMEAVYQWVRNGTVPKEKHKRHLAPVTP
jgi:hypothetical protein